MDRKKSLGDLARCMSLNVDRVWQQTAEGEVLVPISQVCAGDAIVVHTGSVIPLDGRVLDGEASVNQASLTGEAEPVRKSEGAVVYAGTVVEEGQITVTVEQQAGNGRYDRSSNDRELREAEIRQRDPRRRAGRQAGPVQPAGHRRDLRADPQRDPCDLDPDGRFFLCAQAVDAAGRAVRHA